jgi:alkanesulfonate monooxygenase SsuD/methylene tetrahydromethanopterin reductase-like flavin-dependent oxidoreductase (luciferase family)
VKTSFAVELNMTRVKTAHDRHTYSTWQAVLLDDDLNEVVIYGDPQDVADQLEQIVTALRTVAA